jgi:hypothetical protein
MFFNLGHLTELCWSSNPGVTTALITRRSGMIAILLAGKLFKDLDRIDSHRHTRFLAH